MRYARLVHYVRIFARKVDDHDLRGRSAAANLSPRCGPARQRPAIDAALAARGVENSSAKGVPAEAALGRRVVFPDVFRDARGLFRAPLKAKPD